MSEAQATCKTWDERNPVGTLVRYRALIGRETPWDVVGRTRSGAWVVCGTPVVLIEGKAGGVSLDHLEVI